MNAQLNVRMHVVRREESLPSWTSRDQVARFFHETMHPWHDTLADVHRGLDYAFSDAEGKGGFLVVAEWSGELAGAVLFLDTGMGGYVPENLLLFVSVRPDLRSNGIGRELVEHALDHCEGRVKLHVEYDNPARKLYERIGFTSSYAEMRYDP